MSVFNVSEIHPLNWHPGILIGNMNLAALGVYALDDPRSVTLDGILNRANQPGSIVRIERQTYDRMPGEIKQIVRAAQAGRIPLPWPNRGHIAFYGAIQII